MTSSEYLAVRAIDPAIAEAVGVKLEAGEIVYPSGRRRSLEGTQRTFRQPKGERLKFWWPRGRPEAAGVALVTEGESDALAALTALARSPIADLRALPVAAMPGTGFPVDRLVAELSAIDNREALLALDADDAGRIYTGKATEALRNAWIRPVVVPLPDGLDLAEWLAGVPEAERGEALAGLLVDAEAATEELPRRDAGQIAAPIEPVPAGRSLTSTPAAEIAPERVRWAWRDRLPLGAVTLLAGRQGLGKSTLVAKLAADVSRGTLDGDLAGSPGGVLLVSYEDHAASTIVPRLMAADADLARVHLLEANESGHLDLVSLPEDVERIADLARRHDARLILVDPLVAALPGRLDAHRDQDVRRALAPLAQLAESESLAMLCVIHLRKGAAGEALDRISGSVAFTAAARSVLALGCPPDEEDGPGRVLAHAKSNLAPRAASLAYRVEQETVQHDGVAISTSRLDCAGESPTPAEQLLSPPAPADRSETDAAAEWLADELADGDWHASADLRNAARGQEITPKVLRRAREQLGVVVERRGMPACSFWRVPVVPSAGGSRGTTGGGTTARTASESGFPAPEPPSRALDTRQGTTGNGHPRDLVPCEIGDLIDAGGRE